MFPKLAEYILAWDIETRDQYLTKKGKRPSLGPGSHRHYLTNENSYILGVSISDSKNDYWFSYSNSLWEWLWSIEKDHLWVGHNSLYDCSWTYYENFVPTKMADTMVLARLLHEDRLSYSLDNLCRDFLHVGKHEEEITEWCRERKLSGSPQEWLWMMIEEGREDLVEDYAKIDTRRTYDLYQYFIPEIEKQNLSYIWGIECKLLPILVKMNHRGVRVNHAHREKMIEKSLAEEEILKKKIESIVGLKVIEGKPEKGEENSTLNVGSSKQLAPVFDSLGLEYPTTDKGNPSFKSEDMLPYGVEPDDNYLPHLIVQLKKLSKLRRDFLEKLELFAIGDRIYPTIYPWGTKTGRPTSQAPNIFQIPKRGRGKEICRPLFIPEDGEIFVSADVASQELRVFAHYARGVSGQRYRDAYNDADRHYDMHMDNAETAGCDRTKAKTIGLGVLFGMGRGKLSRNLGVGATEGMTILNRFHDRNPSFMQTSREAQAYAEKFGYIKTVSGRKRRFPRGEGAYKALNFLTQGNSADMLKIAIVKANDEGILDKLTLYFYLYDEIDLSIKEENLPYLLRFKELIEGAIPLRVKMLLEIEHGPSWGELSPLTN